MSRVRERWPRCLLRAAPGPDAELPARRRAGQRPCRSRWERSASVSATGCGFITNTAFDPGLVDYSEDYEGSQAFSPRFRSFTEELGHRLVERYGLRGGDVVEIGCGKGEFLELLCTIGGNRGVGIDPAAGRIVATPDGPLTFLAEPYSQRHATLPADLVACRHTLEHIQPVRAFVSLVRRNLDGRPGTAVFFEVPNVIRILEEVAFWDVYYEHCSYFSAGSIARLFRAEGFEVTDLELGFDGQYLLLDARPAQGAPPAPFPLEEPPEALRVRARRFTAQLQDDLGRWRSLLDEERSAGRRIVVWGASSKGVSFLTTLRLGTDAVEHVVDVNPYKQGMHVPGTGQQIIAPEALREHKPDLVVLMNPIYRREVGAELERLGLRPRLLTA